MKTRNQVANESNQLSKSHDPLNRLLASLDSWMEEKRKLSGCWTLTPHQMITHFKELIEREKLK